MPSAGPASATARPWRSGRRWGHGGAARCNRCCKPPLGSTGRFASSYTAPDHRLPARTRLQTHTLRLTGTVRSRWRSTRRPRHPRQARRRRRRSRRPPASSTAASSHAGSASRRTKAADASTTTAAGRTRSKQSRRGAVPTPRRRHALAPAATTTHGGWRTRKAEASTDAAAGNARHAWPEPRPTHTCQSTRTHTAPRPSNTCTHTVPKPANVCGAAV